MDSWIVLLEPGGSRRGAVVDPVVGEETGADVLQESSGRWLQLGGSSSTANPCSGLR